LKKRIRRHVHGPPHRFVAVAPPELAPLCLAEMDALGFTGHEQSPAGVELQGRFTDIYRANLWLRTAGRVLWRVHGFRAGVLEELFYKASVAPWELWLNPRIPLVVEARVERSRIRHEGEVERALLKAVAQRFRYLKIAPPAEGPKGPGRPEGPQEGGDRQRILVRLESNRVLISLDSTGEHLHRRGYRLEHTGAPLRETLAAGLLLKAGWDGDSPLVDGMCGAGTLAIEGALLGSSLPPGGLRSFLFEKWPAFQDKTWNYLLKKAREKSGGKPCAPVVGVDRDPAAVETARANGRRAGVKGSIRWKCMDFLDFRPFEEGLKPGLVILNPPYGGRLPGGRETYHRVGAHLREHFRGWRTAVLAPDRGCAMALGLRPVRFWSVDHGGLRVAVALASV